MKVSPDSLETAFFRPACQAGGTVRFHSVSYGGKVAVNVPFSIEISEGPPERVKPLSDTSASPSKAAH